MYAIFILFTFYVINTCSFCPNSMFSNSIADTKNTIQSFDETYFNQKNTFYYGGGLEDGIDNYQGWLEKGSMCFSCTKTGPPDDFSKNSWSSVGFLDYTYYSPLPSGAWFIDVGGAHNTVSKQKIMLSNTYGVSACMCPENEVFVYDLIKNGHISLSSESNNIFNFFDYNIDKNIHIIMKMYWEKGKMSKHENAYDDKIIIIKNNPCFACPQHSKSTRGSVVQHLQNTNMSAYIGKFGACACNTGYEYITDVHGGVGVCKQCPVGKHSTQYLTPLQHSWTQQDSVGVTYLEDGTLKFPSDFNPSSKSKTLNYTNTYIRGDRRHSYVFDYSGSIRRSGLGRLASTPDANIIYVNSGCIYNT